MNFISHDKADKTVRSYGLSPVTGDLINKDKIISELDSSSAISIVSKQCSFKGDMDSAENIFIAGRFKGNIKCGSTVVSLAGSDIEGRIEARDIVIYGRFSGNVTASNIVKLFPGCAVKSSIKGKTFIIEEGAIFDGEFSRL